MRVSGDREAAVFLVVHWSASGGKAEARKACVGEAGALQPDRP